MAEMKRSMYLAAKGGAYVGVFSAEEKAKAAECEEVREIKPIASEGTPMTERFVFMAEGTWSTLTRVEGRFFENVVELGPIWAWNPQSAVAEITGRGYLLKKGVSIKRLLMFEIDRVYEDGDAQDMSGEYPFMGMIRWLEKGTLNEMEMAKDYAEVYLEEQRRIQEINQRRTSDAMDELRELIVNSDMEIRDEELGHVMPASTAALRKRWFGIVFADEFERHELEALKEAVRRSGSDSRDISEDADLNERFHRCMVKLLRLRVMSGNCVRRTKRLKDYLD